MKRNSLLAIAIATSLTLSYQTATALTEDGTHSESITASSDKSPKVLLRFKFREGEQLRYQSTEHVTRQTIAAGTKRIDTSKVEQRRTYRVGSMDKDGNASISMQFENVRMETKADDNQPSVFDSSMKLSEVPTVFKGAAKKLKGTAPTYSVAATGTALSEDGTEQVQKEGQASFVFPLPQAEIGVGATWKTYMQVKVRVAEGVMRSIRLLRTYKLESIQDDIAVIKLSTSTDSRIRSPSIKALLLQTTPQGTITFDVAKGRVLKRQLTFSKTALGALGKNSMLSATGKTTEVLLEAKAESVAAAE